MTMTTDDLLQYMQTELGIDTADIQETSLLFSEGIVDSFALVSLITFIEKQCRIRVTPSDVNFDNFDSIERILRFIGRTQSDGVS